MELYGGISEAFPGSGRVLRSSLKTISSGPSAKRSNLRVLELEPFKKIFVV
jgi:hypothetical protein